MGKSTRQESGHEIPPDESQQAVRRILEESAAEYMPAIRAGLPASTEKPVENPGRCTEGK